MTGVICGTGSFVPDHILDNHELLFCGAHAFRAEKIETVKEVIDSLMRMRV